jgi:hypothetical protein
MGKRIKWLNDQEADQIREGKLDYTVFYSPVHINGDNEKYVSKEELLHSYKQLERTRLAAIKYQSGNANAWIGFFCPNYVEE